MKSSQIAGLTAGILAISALLPYLLDLGYRPLDGEVLILSAAAAALLGVLSHVLTPFPRAQHALFGLIVYWIADSYFVNALGLVMLAVMAGATTYILLQSRWRPNVQPMLLTFSLFWIVSNLVTPGRPHLNPPLAPAVAGRADLPPLVHVILDEQGSPEATAGAVPAGHPAQQMLGTLQTAGFQVYPNTMSVSEHTRYSLASLFSLRGEQENFGGGTGQFTLAIKDNTYLQRLTAAGYNVTVIQSNYLDICEPAAGITCHTYNRTGHGHAFATRSTDLWLRSRLALLELHSYLHGAQEFGGVFVYNLLARGMRQLGVPMHETVYYSRPPALMDLTDSLRERFAAIEPGEAYVLHLLVPHTPYVLTADCQIRDPSQFAQRGGEDVVPLRVEDIYPLYWDQSACTMNRLLAALQGLDQSREGRRAIVMIHGDHGARITIDQEDDQSHAHDADMRQTIFALRVPGTQGTIDRTATVLQDVFASTIDGVILAPRETAPQHVSATPTLRGSLAAAQPHTEQ